MRRGIGIIAALAISVVVALLALSATASAQEAPPDQPPACTPEEGCTEPGEPPCPKDVLCIDPIECPTGETCVEPIPPPCEPDRPCGFIDTDGDGWDDFTEQEWGSDPSDAASTPEHAYLPETCSDGIDNDGDGATDMADGGCNIDSDEDGRPDPQDNCPWDPNADQADRDADGTGDLCDFDADNDGWDDFIEQEWGSNPNDAASTPEHWFARETCEDGLDNDGDGMTDAADPACAPDNDYDGVADASDNCPAYWNPDQADSDGDGTGDACVDSDGDGFFDGDETAWGSDPNDASSTPEGGINYEACTDGIDNDRDGTLDGDDEGCRIMYAEDGAAPPRADSPEAVALAARDSTKNRTELPVLPLAGAGPAQQNSESNSWWLIAASIGALALVSGAAIYGVRARQRS